MSRTRRLTITLAALTLAAAGAAALATETLAGAATHRTSTATTVGPGPVVTTIIRDGYRLQLVLKPNKPLAAGTVSLRLTRTGKLVNHARVRVTFTMLDMDMGGLTGLLPQTGPGRYSHPGPVLGMSGHWGIRIAITPRHARQFSVSLVDRLGG
jgi:hypothetical protein